MGLPDFGTGCQNVVVILMGLQKTYTMDYTDTGGGMEMVCLSRGQSAFRLAALKSADIFYRRRYWGKITHR